MNEQFRIRKQDQNNWVIERFEEGGEIAKRGRTAGQPKAERWVVTGYFAQLKHAAQRLPDTLLGETGLEVTGQEILERIEQAEARCMAIVTDALSKAQD
jgi:hypothetical protein